MQQQSETPHSKDSLLWTMAKRRAGFKKDLACYVIVNVFLWLIWLLTGSYNSRNDIPWPVWPTAGWGFAMVIEYFSVYKFPKEAIAEREYQKLKDRQVK